MGCRSYHDELKQICFSYFCDIHYPFSSFEIETFPEKRKEKRSEWEQVGWTLFFSMVNLISCCLVCSWKSLQRTLSMSVRIAPWQSQQGTPPRKKWRAWLVKITLSARRSSTCRNRWGKAETLFDFPGVVDVYDWFVVLHPVPPREASATWHSSGFLPGFLLDE